MILLDAGHSTRKRSSGRDDFALVPKRSLGTSVLITFVVANADLRTFACMFSPDPLSFLIMKQANFCF